MIIIRLHAELNGRAVFFLFLLRTAHERKRKRNGKEKKKLKEEMVSDAVSLSRTTRFSRSHEKHIV